MKSEKIVLQLLLARVFLSNNKERKRANTCVAHVSGEEETNKENDGGILEKGIRARCERGAIRHAECFACSSSSKRALRFFFSLGSHTKQKRGGHGIGILDDPQNVFCGYLCLTEETKTV